MNWPTPPVRGTATMPMGSTGVANMPPNMGPGMTNLPQAMALGGPINMMQGAPGTATPQGSTVMNPKENLSPVPRVPILDQLLLVPEIAWNVTRVNDFSGGVLKMELEVPDKQTPILGQAEHEGHRVRSISPTGYPTESVKCLNAAFCPRGMYRVRDPNGSSANLEPGKYHRNYDFM